MYLLIVLAVVCLFGIFWTPQNKVQRLFFLGFYFLIIIFIFIGLFSVLPYILIEGVCLKGIQGQPSTVNALILLVDTPIKEAVSQPTSAGSIPINPSDINPIKIYCFYCNIFSDVYVKVGDSFYRKDSRFFSFIKKFKFAFQPIGEEVCSNCHYPFKKDYNIPKADLEELKEACKKLAEIISKSSK